MALLWLVVIGLGVWVFAQSREVAALKRTIADLAAAPRPQPHPLTFAAPPPPATVEPEPMAPEPPAPEPLAPELLAPEPLTSEPPASVPPVVEPAAPAPPPSPAIEEWQPPPLERAIPERWRARVAEIAARDGPAATPSPAPPPEPSPPQAAFARPPPLQAPPRAPVPDRPRIAASTWLAENGLAWLGGGALMLGGLFLVVYAAQRGFFTPPMRIGAAIVLGAGFLAASEWVRRRPDTPGSRHPLVAAVLAGAGASTLYGAFWSAFALYHLIGLPVAATLIAAVSLGLLALALLHGEALGVLAVVGALLAPALIDLAQWRPLGLQTHLGLVVAAGFVAAGLRRWGAVGALTLLGAVAWASAAIVLKAPVFAALLLLAAVAGPAAGVVARRRREEGPARVDLFTALPTLALIAASLVSLQFRIMTPTTDVYGMGLAIALTVLAAALVRLEVVRAAAFAVPALAASLPAWVAVSFGLKFTGDLEQVLWIVLAATMALSALVLGRGARRDREAILGVGAVGAAAIASLMWARAEYGGGWPSWGPPAGLTVLLAAGAAVLARGAEVSASGSAASDRAVGLWILSAAEALFLAIHAGGERTFVAPLEAAAALALAALAARLGWRGLASAAVAGAVIALAELLRPAFVLDALHGRIALAMLGAVAGGAALLSFAGAWLLRARTLTVSEAMATAALASGLLGAFLILHRLVAGPTPAVGAEPLLEASLRTDVLLAAALALAFRTGEEAGAIARWRLGVVLGLGVLNGLAAQGLAFNPWWGSGEAPTGPPLVNSLALDYLAPAALLTLIARRRLSPNVPGGAIAALAAFGAALTWAVLEVRRDFVGPHMAGALIGRTEGGAYGLVLLAAAIALAWLRRRATADAATRLGYLAAAAHPMAWTGLGLSLLAGVFWTNPWWIGAPLANLGDAALTMSEMALIAVGAVALGRVAWDGGWPVLGRLAMVGALIQALTVAALGVRVAFHGLAVSEPDIGRAEGVAYALLLQVTALALGWARARRTGDVSGPGAWLLAAGRPLGWVALALATFTAVVWVNPWWGPWRGPLSGYGEAALMFGAMGLAGAGTLAQGRLAWSANWPLLARAAVTAAVVDGFGLAMLAVRFAFHGLALPSPGVDRAEGGAYGLLLLGTALALAWLRRRRTTPGADAWLTAAALPLAWPALGLATLALDWWASPWWGPIAAPLGGAGEALLIFAALALGAAAAAAQARLARRLEWPVLPPAAKSAAVLTLFVLLTLVIRWLFRGDDMHAIEREASIETWVFSAAWALFGLGVLVVGGAWRDITLRWLGLAGLIGTVLKVLLFDTARLDGVIRAASWLALGVLLIAGALLARRLNADGATFFRLRRPGSKIEES